MAATNLREYLSGIEQLIDSNQVEDALAHCRHVLKTYPKNIATYRLMGKAYLESKRHSEASDLFQRVLSSIPDDFVAHIGMSIIREDEGNLDAAIWHMERAFESQPSNKAVQGEVRRLYGLREGYEPPKVRLTRGALARMYSHGDLFNQAISELRNALAEDAQRPDLQVLLAEMYFKNNQPEQASTVCSQIIQKLPYCLYANRVMVDMLRNSQHDVEATPYWERVEELDPYAAQVSTLKDVDEVPADSVMIDALELESAMLLGAPAKVDETPHEFEKEELPDWLSVEDMETPASSEETQPDSLMSSLEGLEPLAPEGSASAAFMEDDAGESEPAAQATFRTGALEPDDIPDWLRELRPSNPTAGLDPDATPGKRWTEEFEEAGFRPTGPLDLGDMEAHEAAQEPSEAQAPEASENQAEPQATGRPTGWLPTGELRWLDTAFTEDEESAAAEDSGVEPGTTERELPEWLAELNQAEAEHNTQPVTKPFTEIPDALAEPQPSGALEDQQPEPAAASEPTAEGQPDWLGDLQANAGMAEDDDGELPRTDELPNDAESTQRLDALAGWQQPSGSEPGEPVAAETAEPHVTAQPEAAQEPAAEPDQEQDETLSWLEGLAARRGVAEDELLTDPEQRSRAKPEWLQAEQSPEPEQPQSANLDWLDELAAAAGPLAAATHDDETQQSEPPVAPSANGEVTRDLEEDSPFTQELAAEPDTEDNTPGWLRQFTGSLEQRPPDEPIAPRQLEDAPEWLSELRPGDTDSLANQAEDEAPPEWPREPDSAEPEAEVTPEPGQATEPTRPEGADDTPDWLRSPDENEQPAWDAEPAEEEAAPSEPPAPAIEPRWVPASQLPAGETPASEESEAGEAIDEPAEQAAAYDAADDEDEVSYAATYETSYERPVAAGNLASEEPEARLEPAINESYEEQPGESEPPVMPEAVAPAAPRKRPRGLSAEEVEDRLAGARQALSYGNLNDAAEAYSYFLRRRIRLDEIIADLRAASRRFPRQVAVWQTLGDAYMRNNQLTEALECYTRAKSLL